MKKIIYMLLLCPFTVIAQKKQPSADLNTVFLCLDSVTYNRLFENPFLRDTLFLCREQSGSTNTDSYTGKYFIGQASTLEFFKPMHSQKTGDQYGDLGIEFKTRQLHNLAYYFQSAKKNNIKVSIEPIRTELNGKPTNWYNELNIESDSVPKRFSISVIEYQMEYLLAQGFAPAAIAAPMTYTQYNTKLAGGRKYPRQFNSIREVNITLNPHEFTYLKQMMKVMGFKKGPYKFTKNGITIGFTVAIRRTFRLNSLELDLIDALPERIITVSDHLKIAVAQKSAKLFFEYD